MTGSVPGAGAKTARVAVLGGGVSGVVAARTLVRAGVSVDLIEKGPRLGGLHRSVTIDGVAYDIGAFIFDEQHRLLASFPEVRDRFVPVACRFNSLTPSGRVDHYPMTLQAYIADHGRLHFGRVLAEIAYAKVRHARGKTMTDYIKYYIGASLYHRSGLKTYIERLYGIPDHEVDPSFAQKRLFAVEHWASWRRTVVRLLRRQWTTLGGGSPAYRGAILVRPAEGFDALYARIEAALRDSGVAVRTGCSMSAIRPAGPGFDVDMDSGTQRYDHVLSTIPLEAVAGLLGLSTAGPEYVKLFSLFYRFRGDPGHDSTVLHNFTPGGRWKRLTMFSMYYGLHEGDHYFSVEGTLRDQDTVGLPALQQDFEEHVVRMGLFRGELKYQGGLLTGHAYPVYRTANMTRVVALKSAVQQAGIRIAGRQGQFDYVSSSDAAGNAQEVAEQVVRELTGIAAGGH